MDIHPLEMGKRKLLKTFLMEQNTLGILPTGGGKSTLFSNSGSPSSRNHDCYFPPYFSYERPG